MPAPTLFLPTDAAGKSYYGLTDASNFIYKWAPIVLAELAADQAAAGVAQLRDLRNDFPLGHEIINPVGGTLQSLNPTAGAKYALLTVRGGTITWLDTSVVLAEVQNGHTVQDGEHLAYSGVLSAFRYTFLSGTPILTITYYRPGTLT